MGVPQGVEEPQGGGVLDGAGEEELGDGLSGVAGEGLGDAGELSVASGVAEVESGEEGVVERGQAGHRGSSGRCPMATDPGEPVNPKDVPNCQRSRFRLAGC